MAHNPQNGKTSPPKFPIGRILITKNALDSIPLEEATTGLVRHVAGDWGEVCKSDHRANEAALQEGGRLLSVYRATNGVKYWIITEADRSSTTVLLPEDY